MFLGTGISQFTIQSNHLLTKTHVAGE